MAGDWSRLPRDLLEMIANRLTIYIDYLRFRAVSQDWRSSVSKVPNRLTCQPPWLMLPNSRRRETHRSFFSLSENKVYHLELPEASFRRRCCGSSQGWLVLAEESPAIRLLNPLTRTQIQLPPLSSFPNVLNFSISRIGREYLLLNSSGHRYYHNLREMRDLFLKKVILSSSPSSADGDYIVMAILNETGLLAFCRKGDLLWTVMAEALPYYEDVIYYKGLFYAVDKHGRVAICDVHSLSSMVTIIEPTLLSSGDILYLVNSSGEILLVSRYLEPGHAAAAEFYKTCRFEVFKLDPSRLKWDEVKSLDDHMLFLGKNSSLSLLASDFSGFKGNCIYFTDDYTEANYDGVDNGHLIQQPVSLEEASWYPPPIGWLKLNVDGAALPNGKAAGARVVVRNHDGVIIAQLSKPLPRGSARVAEAEAIRLALFTAVSKGWRKIILESDAKEIVELIEGISTNQLGDIVTLIADIHHLQGLCEDLVFRVIKRQANSLAHFSAQQSLSASLSRFHSQSFPSQLSPGAPSIQAQGPAQGSL
ncbi:hypothetical protein HHK36_010391 [Tetracentron sinense]|uniref:F-box domain-containing protein n=1 Tax=Tetracentron sinense TaxID=13715 RepID=A0A835DMK3_TETSI|nr:hypothetical protein HHK36_010391 [Tetracentron sinense]